MKNDYIEKSAVCIFSQLLYSNDIDNTLSYNDKTKNVDGFFTIDIKDYNVQVKGSGQDFKSIE